MIFNWKCENAQIFHLVQLNGFTTLKCWPNDFYNFKFYSFNKTCLMRGFEKKLLYMYGQNTKCYPCCKLECPRALVGVNITEEKRNPNSTKFKCCSGFCVDLIRKFSADLSFDFALKRVKVSCDWWMWIPIILVSDWSRTGRGAAS